MSDERAFRREGTRGCIGIHLRAAWLVAAAQYMQSIALQCGIPFPPSEPLRRSQMGAIPAAPSSVMEPALQSVRQPLTAGNDAVNVGMRKPLAAKECPKGVAAHSWPAGSAPC